MSQLQPDVYAAFPNTDALIADLLAKPQLDGPSGPRSCTCATSATASTPPSFEVAVTRILVPGLRGSIGGQILGLLCPGRLCARSGRPVMSGPAPSR